MLAGSYQPLQIVLALAIAILTIQTMLDIALHIRLSDQRSARWWGLGGSLVLGVSIWSLPFVGMMAYVLPVPVGYDLLLTLLTLLLAIVLAGPALWLVSRTCLPTYTLLIGGGLFGAGVILVNMAGLGAMRLSPAVVCESRVLAVTLLLSVLIAMGALWSVHKLAQPFVPRSRWQRYALAGLFGAAVVSAQHYGLSGLRFSTGMVRQAWLTGLGGHWLTPSVAVLALMVALMALIICRQRIQVESRTASRVQSLAKANEELSYLALHDSLTKLPNRLLLADRLQQAIQKARRNSLGFALMYLDLDGFKAINDGMGHACGDRLLVHAAQRIQATLRAADTVARVGGDEFVVLLEVFEPTDVAAVAEKLLESIKLPFVIEGHALSVSTSVGIALYPGDAYSAQELLAHADAAMFHAKRQGRNGFCFYETSMNATVHQQLALMQDLKRARECQELVLHYQPKVQPRDGTVIGVEALLRWQHPVRGLLNCEQFIALANKSGLILPIGEWVLDEACRQLAQWRNDGAGTARSSWTMAINLSAIQFSHPSLLPTLEQTLKRHQLAPSALILEISEATITGDITQSMRVMQQLKALGVQVAITDFGSRQSSLMHLKRLQVNEIKINRSFVRELDLDDQDQGVIGTLVALSQILGMAIVAEGVETAEQLDFLSQAGCKVLQGYYLGRPVCAQALSDEAAATRPNDAPCA
jgi:diguanylate cyclase (GGDEF)-like protein